MAGNPAASGEDLFFLRRRKELFLILRARIGSGVDIPESEDGTAFLEAYADMLRYQYDPGAMEFFLRRFAAARARWCDEQSIRKIVRGASDPRRMSQRAVGIAMGLRDAERVAWGITTVAAGDLSKKEAEGVARERKRERDRVRAAERRRDAGSVSRDAYLSSSLAANRPWDAAGVSRRTWERRRLRETETVASSSRPINREKGGDGLATHGVSPWIEAGISRATWFRRQKIIQQ